MSSETRRTYVAGLLLLAFALVPGGIGFGASAAASDIKYIVNNVPITDYDISRRVAFLKLQRQRGNLRQKAEDAMIEQTLRFVEMKRLKIDIPDNAVEDAYKNFARQNGMSLSQLNGVMTQSGVTKSHFKEFIKVQMGWGRALRARFQATERLSEQDIVQRMLQDGGKKPTATEYVLQQVIFVVPQSERSKRLKQRKREAEAMRQRFTGCDSTREFAKGLIDVTVRDLGRVIEPELPPDWATPIKATTQGKATPVRETQRGVEFIGVCRTREVSDDRVAQMVFQNEGADEEKADALSEKYMKELREAARIVKR